jgi:ribonuclease P protein component
VQSKFGLSKDEILRGHNSFKKVIDSSSLINGNYVSLYIQIVNVNDRSFDKSPQIKVGFMLSKKKIPEASRRNTLRRQMKEIFRLNKNKILIQQDKYIVILMSACSHAAAVIRDNKKIDYHILEKDILKLFEKINLMLK